jgi:hypothetical protein
MSIFEKYLKYKKKYNSLKTGGASDSSGLTTQATPGIQYIQATPSIESTTPATPEPVAKIKFKYNHEIYISEYDFNLSSKAVQIYSSINLYRLNPEKISKDDPIDVMNKKNLSAIGAHDLFYQFPEGKKIVLYNVKRPMNTTVTTNANKTLLELGINQNIEDIVFIVEK